jgi:hypothetical protein
MERDKVKELYLPHEMLLKVQDIFEERNHP